MLEPNKYGRKEQDDQCRKKVDQPFVAAVLGFSHIVDVDHIKLSGCIYAAAADDGEAFRRGDLELYAFCDQGDHLVNDLGGRDVARAENDLSKPVHLDGLVHLPEVANHLLPGKVIGLRTDVPDEL